MEILDARSKLKDAMDTRDVDLLEAGRDKTI